MKINRILLVLSILFSGIGMTNSAPVISYDSGTTTNWSGYNMGFEFTPNLDIYVTDLGFYDRDGNGLAFDQPVGIYKVSDQSLVVSATVTPSDPSSGNSPQGFFAYHTLSSSVTLTAGIAYRISAAVQGSGAPHADSTIPYTAYTNFSASSDVTLGHAYYISAIPLTYPSNDGGATIYGGANFLYTTVVPEPSSVALICVGGMAFLSWRARKKFAQK